MDEIPATPDTDMINGPVHEGGKKFTHDPPGGSGGRSRNP
jgi:hypothetical protein